MADIDLKRVGLRLLIGAGAGLFVGTELNQGCDSVLEYLDGCTRYDVAKIAFIGAAIGAVTGLGRPKGK